MKFEDIQIAGRYLCTLEAQVAAPFEMARHGDVSRRMIPILGGTVSGRISGRITEGGADWQFMNVKGVTDLEAHYCLELEGGDCVEVQSSGVRAASPEIIERMMAGEQLEPDSYYFRTGIKFRTSSTRYDWLTRFITVGIGTREKDRVIIRLFEIL